MKHIFLILVSIVFIASCGPDKQDALDYYEQIYKSSVPVRTSESRVFNALHDYVDAMNASDSSWYYNTIAWHDLTDSNKVVISNIDKAISELQLLEKFDHNSDLAGKSIQILKEQKIFHEVTVVNLISAFSEGTTTSQSFETAAQAYDESLTTIKNNYKDYKTFRSQFCEDFEITYDDILIFQNKYAPEVSEE